MNELTQTKFNIPIINPTLIDIQIEIPQMLWAPLVANTHLIPRFYGAIQGAVQASFNHPDTKMRGDITQQEIKDRVNLCYEAIKIMYYEEKISLIQALDILSGVLIDTLRAAYNTGAMTDGRGCTDQARRWGLAGHEEVCEVDDSSNLNMTQEETKDV